ncbi:MAG: hypothetical protein HY234_11655 [Acidobacteria bacterium]|nr:hypothetical protein [Acidobacteriota bacterium]MBI3663688.1 hypothetical protein [Acidobacteriota bacterium]
MKLARRIAVLATVLFFGASGGAAAQSTDPVQKAKVVVRQGEAQLELVRREVKAENYDEALRVLSEYRDAIKSAHAGLKASGRDAEKKPGGFKNLQIHLRRSVQRLDQTILSLPVEQREPFEAIRRELDAMDKELIDALFPRQPAKKAGETKPGR